MDKLFDVAEAAVNGHCVVGGALDPVRQSNAFGALAELWLAREFEDAWWVFDG